MKARDILVATHGHCFDGTASAVLFTRLLQARGEVAPFRYKSCGYGPGMQVIPEAWLDGADNAILDFRYTPSKRLGWYFDHHVTAFGSAEERDAALHPSSAANQERRVYWEPAYSSCAKLIADIAKDRFGVDMSPLTELIEWADVIDAARFASAEAATSPDEPVLQLAAVIEHHGDGPFLTAIVPKLLQATPTEVAREPAMQALWAPIRASRAEFAGRVERAAQVLGQVVLVDLTDAPLDVAAKFVTYARYPRCAYSVMLTRNKQHFKLSVGHNPWSGVPRTHDIAAICRREGGGGHPAVGACSFPLSAEARAREVARSIAEELSQ
jgi:hypothetical protein